MRGLATINHDREIWSVSNNWGSLVIYSLVAMNVILQPNTKKNILSNIGSGNSKQRGPV